MEDKISIIVPCFKAEKYIATILCDVRAQRYANWELLVVGNGPGQQIQADIVRRVSAEDSRVRIFLLLLQGLAVQETLELNMRLEIGLRLRMLMIAFPSTGC